MIVWADKAEAYAATRGFDANVLLGTRLSPDMFPLARQVQAACDNAKFGAARLSGIEAPAHPDEEKTIAELRERIRSALAYLETVTPEGLAESAGGPRYRVTFLESQRLESGGFRDSKKPPDARSAFAGLDGVDTVRELSRKDGEVRVEIAAHKKGDLRAEIFRAAVEAGMVVVGFETKTQNLDQVFRDLTTREAPASRGRPTKRAAKAEEE